MYDQYVQTLIVLEQKEQLTTRPSVSQIWTSDFCEGALQMVAERDCTRSRLGRASVPSNRRCLSWPQERLAPSAGSS